MEVPDAECVQERERHVDTTRREGIVRLHWPLRGETEVFVVVGLGHVYDALERERPPTPKVRGRFGRLESDRRPPSARGRKLLLREGRGHPEPSKQWEVGFWVVRLSHAFPPAVQQVPSALGVQGSKGSKGSSEDHSAGGPVVPEANPLPVQRLDDRIDDVCQDRKDAAGKTGEVQDRSAKHGPFFKMTKVE